MIIGVTGGIASGKSEVCRILEKLGYEHIDADDVAHSVLEMPAVIDRVTDIFGNEILFSSDRSGGIRQIDRKKLGAIVFADAEKMSILEGITHPKISEVIREMTSHGGNFVIEAIALISSGIIEICDELWVVHAEPEQQIDRLMNNRGLTYEQAIDRLNSQKDHDWDENTADHIIYSTEPIESMEKQVCEALNM